MARHAFGQTFAYHALIRLAPIRASGENHLGFARPARLPRLCPGARLPLKAYAAFDRLTGPGQHWPTQTYRGLNDIHGSPRGRGGMQSREAERLFIRRMLCRFAPPLRGRYIRPAAFFFFFFFFFASRRAGSVLAAKAIAAAIGPRRYRAPGASAGAGGHRKMTGAQ